jgi:preprotein translocase subunit SecG
MKETIFNIAQLILSVLLIVAILLQQQGAGLSGVFGGSSNVYTTKRGFNSFLHIAVIVLATIFFGASFLRLVM